MLKRYAAGPQLKLPRAILAVCCLALVLLLFPARLSAYTTSSPTRGLSLQANAGFDENYRVNFWTPVRITLNDSGSDFSGMLTVLTFNAQARSNAGPATYTPWSFEVSVKLRRGASKQMTLNIPLYVGPNYPFGVEARVLDTQGHVVADLVRRN